MQTSNIIHSLLKQNYLSDNKALTFRTGQIFSGKVLKLYPNQIAEVQVGSHKVLAQLEIPLTVNENQWFQVESAEGKVHLKVLDTQGTNEKQLLVGDLLKQFSLPETKENIALLQHFVKEQLPITKETIRTAAEWIKSSQSIQDSLQAISALYSKQLPFTESVFQSITSIIKDDSFLTLLENLQTLLKNHTTTITSTRLLSMINEMSMTEKERTINLALSTLIKEAQGIQDPVKSETAMKLLQDLGFFLKETTAKEGLEFSTEQPKNSNNILIANKKIQTEVQSLLSTLSKNRDDALVKFTQLLSLEGSGAETKLSSKEQELLTSIKREVLDSIKPVDAHVVKDQLKNLIQKIGFSYENEAAKLINNQNQEENNKIEMLKPLLMQFLKDEPSAPFKDAAEKLLLKITGYQVLSQEVGPVQQYVFQLPITFWDKKLDMTMQWSGRKSKYGKIDPNYCRVLFYLNLDHLKETIVDLQVQNRVINIFITNDRKDLKVIATPFVAQLKESLAQLNYHLSSVTYNRTTESKKAINGKLSDQFTNPSTIIVPNKYNGVDFRI
ncbi:hypothetical protein [Cytobacillus dafuensis]|uniref:Flagellar hook-length control protein FliK n=1 Tax=Cytobacillus dafuensis TaxID=1742359 RepID=A0A5B8Z7W9_CYTDA|nr:hypothetical protein [Cytobacillus dafuensis]QED47526.1 hypothetical protein FSZ17_09800 [Cytobacillus dafuensis]